MVRLRSTKESDPTAAIGLARDGNRRFPDSADAPERTSILIHALASQGASSEARVEQFTGAHRHRNIRLNDAGQLEYY
jgi:hypothetical protein